MCFWFIVNEMQQRKRVKSMTHHFEGRHKVDIVHRDERYQHSYSPRDCGVHDHISATFGERDFCQARNNISNVPRTASRRKHSPGDQSSDVVMCHKLRLVGCAHQEPLVM